MGSEMCIRDRYSVYIEWKAGLFFPKGLPSDLLQVVKGEYENKNKLIVEKNAKLAAEIEAKNLSQLKIKRPGGYPR